MATLYRRQDSKYWWAKWYDSKGEEQRASTKQTSKQKAAVRAAKLERESIFEADKPPDYTLLEALELQLAIHKRNRRTDATISIHQEKGRHLTRVFGPAFNVAGVELVDTERYVDVRVQEGASLHTIEKEVRVLIQAARAARKRKLIPADKNLEDLRPDVLRDVYSPRERVLDEEEYDELLLKLAESPRTASRIPYVQGFCHSGVRHSELFRIHAHHLDASSHRVWVDGTKTRQSKRWVYLGEEGWEVFSRQAEEHPRGPIFPDFWTASVLRRTLSHALASLEPPREGVSANDLRRTFCSWLCSAGVSEHMCAQLMGHKDSRMVRAVYGRLSDEALANAVKRLPVSTWLREGRGVEVPR